MNSKRALIAKFQLFFLIIQSQIGIGLLSLPSDIQKSAGGDGWLSVLLAGAAVQLLLILYWLLYRRYPNKTLSEMTVFLFGRWIGRACNLVYSFFFILVASLASALFIRLINNWLLPLTPRWILFVLIPAACVYLVLEDLRVIARFLVVSSLLIVLLILMSLLNLSNEMHIDYMLPVGQSGLANIFSGSQNTFLAMVGFEIVLYAMAQVNGGPKGVLGTVTSASLFVTLLYTFFVILCLVTFSPDSLVRLNEPILFLFKGLSYRVLERLDLIFLSIWIVPMTTSIIVYLYMAARSLSSKRRSYRRAVFGCSILLAATGYYFSTLDNLELVSYSIQYVYLAVIGGGPAILLLLSLLRKRERGDPL